MKRLLPAWVGAPRLDPILLLLLLLIIGFGLIVLYSASGQDMAVVNRQAIRLGFGLVVMLVISQVPPRVLRAWTPWLYGIGVAMLLATLVLGVGRSTQRWLDFIEEAGTNCTHLMVVWSRIVSAYYVRNKRKLSVPPSLGEYELASGFNPTFTRRILRSIIFL